jgi:uncharacterized SAM-binding protein YcdF (DUF218 family)
MAEGNKPMYHLLTTLLQPLPALSLGLLVAALLVLRRNSPRRLHRVLLVAFAAGIVLLSTPLLGYWALRTLENVYPPRDSAPTKADTILVLAGGVRIYDGPEEHFRLSPASTARCLHALWLYRKAGGCRIVLAGGKVDPTLPGPAEAQAMRDFLVAQGVRPSDLLLEDHSRSTYENALYCRALLEEHKTAAVVLVTDAAHMPRASRCFRAQGVEVVEAPCNYQAGRLRRSPTVLLPCAQGVEGVQTAVHEWLGLAWYWLLGRI